MRKIKFSPLQIIVLSLSAIAVILAVFFFAYTAVYYHADGTARKAAEGSAAVSVRQADGDLFFDGPGEDDLLIFYPGAKVEHTAYAPLMLELAKNGLDCVIVRMPFRLAFLGTNKADVYLAKNSYSDYYLGGHSLGGAIAASYASKHQDRLDGLILLAAYPTGSLGNSFPVLSVYGSEDTVLNRDKLAKGEQYMPEAFTSVCIQGGNHACFGSYGEQAGDGAAAISPEVQWALTRDAVLAMVGIVGD